MSAQVMSAQTNGVSPTPPPKTIAKSRGQLKKLKQKQKKLAGLTNGTHKEESETPEPSESSLSLKSEPSTPRVASASLEPPDRVLKREESVDGVDRGYVDDTPQFDPSDPSMAAFADVFARFQTPDEEGEGEDTKRKSGIEGKGDVIYSDEEVMSGSDSEKDEEGPPVSKRKMRKATRLSVAELKRLVKKPEVVEWVDVTAQDPKLLVQLKSYRNTVSIPAHWSMKRDYLQGKRGIEKPPFQLPSFIADTGIASQRDAIKEKEENMSLKAKTRERVQPKMGKIDIDYQKLHDAFFKYQTKPKMTDFGEMYYEGKEFETKLKEKKPGDLSEELKEALSIPPLAPPPWLISMQRYGPPPSYPNLKIPGLNAPIPEGAQWGFHPGGWGKPPVDEYNRPLYGDVFGMVPKQDYNVGEPVSKELWGELEPDEEESEDEEEEEEEEEEEGAPGHPADGLQTPSGLETPSGFASVTSTVPGGLETPDFMDLRKQREETVDEDTGPKHLYQVIPEKQSSAKGFLGSDRVYDVRGINQGQPLPVLGQEDRGTKRKAGGVDIALDASELEGLSEDQLRARYEQSRKGAMGMGGAEDFSDMVAQETAKKRKVEENRKKKEKEFKF